MTVRRFIGSFLAAVVVVAALLAIGVRLVGPFERSDVGLVFHEVDVLSASEKRELADVLGTAPRPMALPPMADIPPLEFHRTVRGFVQLEVSIGIYGRVTDVKVLGSTLPPSYHQRAIDMVRHRRYEPEVVAGEAVAGYRLEIVDFNMEAPVGNLDPTPSTR